MGRKRVTEPPLDVGVIQASFTLRQNGALIRSSTLEPAAFTGPGNKLLVRVYRQGRIRRIAYLRAAWILATGEIPRGVIRPRDGDERNATATNLLLTKAGARPFDQGNGARASALAERTARNAALLNVLATHPEATVPQLSRLVGASVPCTCVRLAKLEAQGLACSPKWPRKYGLRWPREPGVPVDYGAVVIVTAIPALSVPRTAAALCAFHPATPLVAVYPGVRFAAGL
jgi:hypothetical protein